MGCPVILTPQSRDDLKKIVSYVARHNPDRARSFGNELLDRALAIGQFPELGRAVPEVNDATVREVIYGPYRIIYEIFRDPDAIYVCDSGMVLEESREFKQELLEMARPRAVRAGRRGAEERSGTAETRI